MLDHHFFENLLFLARAENEQKLDVKMCEN